MRRKLVSYDAFEKLVEGSLSNAAHELSEVQNIVSGILEVDSLSLHCYDDTSVIWETASGDYLRANYRIHDNRIELSNIENVVIDEDSNKDARRRVLAEMLDAVLEDNTAAAGEKFHKFLEIVAPKMKYMKGSRTKSMTEKVASNLRTNEESDAMLWGAGGKDIKRSQAAKKAHRMHPDAAKVGHRKRKVHKSKIAAKHKSPAWQAARRKAEVLKSAGRKQARVKGTRYDDWSKTATNVVCYVEHTLGAPIADQTQIQRDDLGNVCKLCLPVSKVRNEGKILSLKYDTLKTDVKVLREQAARLSVDEKFQQAIAAVKRCNNMSDNEQLEDMIGGLVGQFPSVLYLTQQELAKTVSEALANQGASNYDDQTCNFIAEGILRVAFASYPERVKRIASLSQTDLTQEGKDAYEVFQTSVQEFYPSIDENVAVEMQVFADLHDIFSELRETAIREDAEILRQHAVEYLGQLTAVLEGKVKPSLSLAEEAAAYLMMLDEANMDPETWNVNMTPYRTEVGDHPDMQKKANQSYAPKDENKWSKAGGMVSDGKSVDGKFDGSLWANRAGDTVNPYLPSSEKPTIKGEKAIGDDGLGQDGGSDTWPSLQNPYCPASVKPHVNNDNRVDGK